MRVIIAGNEYDLKMCVRFGGRTYGANTALDLIKECMGMDWGYKFAMNAAKEMAGFAGRPEKSGDVWAEVYIAYKTDEYREATGKEMILPDGDIEARAIAMFEAISAIGGWHYEREK